MLKIHINQSKLKPTPIDFRFFAIYTLHNVKQSLQKGAKMSHNTHPDIRLFLLPTGFKKFGYLFLALVIMFICLQGLSILNIEKEMFKAISTSGLLAALLILAQSKLKDEDERTIRARLIAWFSAAIYLLIGVIVAPFVSSLFDGEFVLTINISQQLLSMLLFYFVSFFIVTRM